MLFAHSQYEKATAELGIEYHAYDTADEYQQLLADASWLNTPNTIPKFLRQHVLPRSERIMALIEDKLEPGDMLIAPPLFDIAPRIVAEKLGLRLLSAFLAPAQVALSPLRTLMFEKVLAPQINSLRQRHQLLDVADWQQWLRYSNPSLALWPAWFAPSEANWIEGVTPTGFLMGRDNVDQLPLEVREFLSAYPNPVLLTGGTGAFLDASFYRPSIEAITNLEVPAIVVTRYTDQLPERLSDQILVARQLPFSRLIPHTSLVIHHGGIGTTAETLRSGRPQLILAQGADRPDNGARIQRLGVGDSLAPAQWTVAEIANRINQLRKSRAIQERCSELAETIKQEQSNSDKPWLAALN